MTNGRNHVAASHDRGGERNEMPAPIIEFDQFINIHRWWLRNGTPPWLADPRWWVNAFRSTLVLGILGSISGWLTFAFFEFASLLPIGEVFQGWVRLLIAPGLCFGVVVLVPFSRWIGRGWIFSWLSIPAAMFAWICSLFAFLGGMPMEGDAPYLFLFGFFAGFTGAVVIAGWCFGAFGTVSRGPIFPALLVPAILAGCGCAVVYLYEPRLAVPGPLHDWFTIGLAFVTFQCLTAIGLGVHLWWPGLPPAGNKEPLLKETDDQNVG
jgi:hypothetical protein